MTKALIVVDVQNDFIDGSLPVPGGQKVAEDIATLIRDSHPIPGSPYANELYDYVVTTQDWHYLPGKHWSKTPDYVDSWPVHCKAGTEGANLHDAIKGIDFDAKFYKGAYSAAYSGFEGISQDEVHDRAEGLASWMVEHRVTDVDVVGLALDYCVKATALDAAKAGFKTRVLNELTRPVTPEGGLIAKFELETAGVKVV